ncbi:MAG: biopolymer transporter ExbD [Acidobacteriaceae bacterium]|nr:biopolymer transporter ExbD [Acidobacteriaceae bacterium]
MAFSTNGGSSGVGRGRFRGTSTLSEINVVPLVDVVLVLLIIFMLTAHVMEFGMEVDVPHTKETKTASQDLPVVTISKDGNCSLNDRATNIHVIGQEILRRYGGQKAVYLRADKNANWDSIAQVVAALGDAKLAVNMVTQPVEAK